MFSEWPSAIAAWSSWRTIRLLFATGRRTRVSLICVHSLPKRSSTASYSTCCPKALSRCATSAFLHLAAANAWLLCANSSSRNTRRTWEFQKPHQSQLIQLQSQSCAAQVVASRCFFSALFNLRGAVHHEPHRFPPHFPLDAGFQSCTHISTCIRPGTIQLSHFVAAFFACVGWLIGCTIFSDEQPRKMFCLDCAP